MEKESYLRWVEFAVDDADVALELRLIRDNPDQIHERFYRGLEFGTGGLRGVLGAGSNRMNIYTVRQATRGLAVFLLSNFEVPSVAIAYDSRHKSQLFAMEAAKVLSLSGITVNAFDRLMPTPALSYAVRQLGCSAGIMITASHNPAKYNGYKVYGADGCQITEKAAESIMRSISGIDPFDAMQTADKAAPINTIPESLHGLYYQAVLAQRAVQDTHPSTLSIVYTPLNGSGFVPVTDVLREAGYADVNVVASQSAPDGDFPTCPYPNPELPETLKEGIDLCREINADIVLATDPDCDRVGVAVPNHRGSSEFRLLNGNEVGVMLLNYICSMRRETGTMPQNPIAIKTIVTTDMASAIASQYGVTLVNVLTGFKYIGETIGKLEQAGEAGRFIFGFEESCGYLSGIHARDKDAVNACLLICDMAAYYLKNGKTLAEQMDLLYETYRHYACALDSFEFDGEEGEAAMRNMMRLFRENLSNELFGYPVRSRIDYLEDNEGLPPSDVLQYVFEDDTLLTIRPSGTEPKMKVYYQVVRATRDQAEEALADMRANIKAVVIG